MEPQQIISCLQHCTRDRLLFYPPNQTYHTSANFWFIRWNRIKTVLCIMCNQSAHLCLYTTLESILRLQMDTARCAFLLFNFKYWDSITNDPKDLRWRMSGLFRPIWLACKHAFHKYPSQLLVCSHMPDLDAIQSEEFEGNGAQLGRHALLVWVMLGDCHYVMHRRWWKERSPESRQA